MNRTAETAAGPVLEVEDLKVYFASRDGIFRAVDGLTFSLSQGETLGLVGESGCGKSVTAMSLLRLIPSPPSVVAGGSIRYKGEDLVGASEKRMRELRGNEISMIFQDPMTSLNPVLTIGEQIAETIMLHQRLGKRPAWDRATEMLQLVGIPEPAKRVKDYPHQFSGGMRQRAMIALALACNPNVLIADEPSTALDVTIQAQILELMVKLKEEFGTAIIMITHDLGVVAETCARVMVMYAGRKVEEAPVAELFGAPLHPYTQGLMASVPKLDLQGGGPGRRPRLAEIPGMVPALKGELKGCAFAPRCPRASDACRAGAPPLERRGEGHWVACWIPGEA
jgi:peptide/nickel transport system ATP-binding protein